MFLDVDLLLAELIVELFPQDVNLCNCT